MAAKFTRVDPGFMRWLIYRRVKQEYNFEDNYDEAFRRLVLDSIRGSHVRVNYGASTRLQGNADFDTCVGLAERGYKFDMDMALKRFGAPNGRQG